MSDGIGPGEVPASNDIGQDQPESTILTGYEDLVFPDPRNEDVPLELEEIQGAEHQAARRDPLTKLPNRRWVNENLRDMISRTPGEFAVLFVDLDDTKPINDGISHDAGDRYLVGAANALRNAIARMVDADDPLHPGLRRAAADRLSGDEFVVVLDGIQDEESLARAKEIVAEEMAAMRVVNPADRSVIAEQIKASIGYKQHEIGETAAQLLESADSLMAIEKAQHKQEKFDALPWRKRFTAKLGMWLLDYAGVTPPRSR